MQEIRKATNIHREYFLVLRNYEKINLWRIFLKVESGEKVKTGGSKNDQNAYYNLLLLPQILAKFNCREYPGRIDRWDIVDYSASQIQKYS